MKNSVLAPNTSSGIMIANPHTPYIENIIAFLENLRNCGLLIGTAEAGEVARLLELLGTRDREIVRAALGSMLATTQKELGIFGKEFDAFFIGEKAIIEQEVQRATEQESRRRNIDDAKESLEMYDVPDDIAEAYADASGERREWLRNMLEYAHDGNRNLPLMKEYLKRIANGWLSADAGIGVGSAPEEDEDLFYKDLSSITEDEVPQALRLIEMLVRRINLSSERKYKRAGRRGLPDVRKTIHSSLRTGGVPVNPVYKRRPRSSHRVVILCDISESMYRFSGFALRFISAMGMGAGKIRAFIFSEGAEEISVEDIGRFEKKVKDSDLWRRGTDIGGAIEYVLGLKPSAIPPQTSVIILSDAKTIDQPRTEAALAEISQYAKSIIWLNPDRTFSAFATKLSETYTILGCSSLDELARACAKL